MPPVKNKNGKAGVHGAAAKVERKLEYPDFRAKICTGDQAITSQQMKKLLGWESEADYKARMCRQDKSLKGEEVGFGDDYVLKDENGQKVRLWHVTVNRPFAETRSRKYSQTILNRQWAGPLNFPGETITSDALGVGRYGELAQGVHRAVALILACQRWEREEHWKEKWPTEPVLESLVIFGMSEDPRILACLDNVDARSESDVIYTSNIFNDLEVSVGASVRPAFPKEKQDCCRMLAKAIDVLWLRLDAPGLDTHNKYKTHALAMDFQRRHAARLKECTLHIFQENMHRGLSSLKLSQGECVAMMYLMGCSGSTGADITSYRLADPLPTEDRLNWSRMDKARKFWVELGKPMKVGKSKLLPVQKALNALLSDDGGGRAVEKRAIIAKAWTLFVAGDAIQESDLDLSEHWQENINGEKKFVNAPDFGGADVGERKVKDQDEELTEAQVEENKKREQEQFRLEMEQKLAAAKKAQEGPSRTVAESGAPGGKPPAPKLLPAPANKRPGNAPSGKASQGAAALAPDKPASPKAGPEGAKLAGALGKVGPALGTPGTTAKKSSKK